MYLNAIKIKTKGYILAFATLFGFLGNIVLVYFLLEGTDRNILIGGSFLGMIFFFIFTIVMVTSITNSIGSLSDITLDLAQGSGDLTKRIRLSSKDEIADLSENINKFIEKIHLTVIASTTASQENYKMANRFSNVTYEIDKRMSEELIMTKNTKDLGDFMKTELDRSTHSSKQTSEDIVNASKTLNETAQEIRILVQDIQKASEVESQTSDRLTQLSNDANQVKNILTVISDIADQTNLLALNAAIEAARAGEHGRGFAVVADEVRNLAERTQRSLTEINATISVIVQNIINASGEMVHNYHFIEKIAHNSQKAETNICHVEEIINNASQTSLDASSISQHLSNETTQMLNNINLMYSKTVDNSSGVKELNSASAELLKQSTELSSRLSQFKI
ncbi:MAG: methyl-accepting chemotaxis protein [Sulfurospirillaceae bacterium]|nr:methyl-accepting chemotaxis protein [Sulfurospirillaceae bacterium]